MKLKGYRRPMCNKHVHSTMTRSSRFHCLIGVINKPTTGELWISPVYRRLAVVNFLKSAMQNLLAWPWPHPLRQHSLITRLTWPTRVQNLKSLAFVTLPRPRPFQGIFFVGSLRLALCNLCTKFKVPACSCYEDMNGGAKCKNWGCLGQLSVTRGHPQCHHSIERIRLPIRH